MTCQDEIYLSKGLNSFFRGRGGGKNIEVETTTLTIVPLVCNLCYDFKLLGKS